MIEETCGGSARREKRCLCGSLAAVFTAEGVELKCRRCKRLILIAYPAAWSEGFDVSAAAAPGRKAP